MCGYNLCWCKSGPKYFTATVSRQERFCPLEDSVSIIFAHNFRRVQTSAVWNAFRKVILQDHPPQKSSNDPKNLRKWMVCCSDCTILAEQKLSLSHDLSHDLHQEVSDSRESHVTDAALETYCLFDQERGRNGFNYKRNTKVSQNKDIFSCVLP